MWSLVPSRTELLAWIGRIRRARYFTLHHVDASIALWTGLNCLNILNSHMLTVLTLLFNYVMLVVKYHYEPSSFLIPVPKVHVYTVFLFYSVIEPIVFDWLDIFMQSKPFRLCLFGNVYRWLERISSWYNMCYLIRHCCLYTVKTD